MYLGGSFRTRPPPPMSAAGMCGASPLVAPAGLSLRSAPRRAQRAASEERARNERATSEERFRTSPARSSRVGRSGGGRQAVGRRSARAGRSVGGRWSVGLRAPRRPARSIGGDRAGRSLRGAAAAPRGVATRRSAAELPRRGRGRGSAEAARSGWGGVRSR